MKTLVAGVATILALALVFIAQAIDQEEMAPLLGCITFGLLVWWITCVIHHVGADVTVERRETASPSLPEPPSARV